MKSAKRMIASAMAVVMLILCYVPVYAADRPITVYLDGKKVDFGVTNGEQVQALTLFDYAYVPVAKIVEILTGKAPDWDNTTKTATYTYNGNSYKINTNESGIYVNGQFIPSVTGTPPRIVNDRTLIPLKMLTSAMGFGQSYEKETHSTWLTSATVKTPAATAKPTSAPAVQTTVNFVSATADKTSVQSGETVTVKVTGTANAASAKLVDSSNKTVAETRKYMAEGSYNVFTLEFKPTESGKYRATIGSASDYKDIDITVNKVALDLKSVSVSNSSPSYNSTVTVIIKTSTAATKVWLYNTSKGKFSETTSGYTDSGDTREWRISYTVDLYNYQSYTAYASDASNNEAKRTFNLNVNGSSSSSSSIIRSISASPTNIQAYNQASEISVRTNKNVTSVDFSLSGVGQLSTNYLYASDSNSYYDSGDERIWRINFYSTGTEGTAVITANAYDNSANQSAKNEVRVTVGSSSSSYIQSMTRNSYGDLYTNSSFSYQITTGWDVYRLRVSTNDGASSNNFTTESYYQNGDIKYWDINLTTGSNYGTYRVEITAYNSSGSAVDSRSDSYYVK